ncbi:type VII secretion protein EccC [Streptomyces cinereoruber]|uniref:Type VII secretion protein EccC n=1 Tax=Streptomyces cinereoruber TaxID=67260 RepID=A0AAV4KPR5_9ACTN|nr:type VII secretion protein EccCa [Streptomyces cinereoruber]MBB4158275.1 S-DNA-T family DNA segregation ATPase FtsK/SpoIIIE [Streptomyces cinereoruber]MBY8814231.1 type VII secretion protein EccCa [Streptomyces cinereoruber]NIH58936.1 S-DNA-T family DNA segregation ATPase FtsK/SpoIIIE [Streptomyces cinereoruber]QEV35095.1 type VII secretion protein EccCa [Streptomyces cinereoruber]GGR45893.1 type VII secretion protein EccC [Streptomyces cinereoruber]
MSQIVVKRPPRALPSEVPSEQVQLQSPPELPRGQQEGALMQLLPMLGMGGSVVFFFMTPNPIMRIMGMIMIASTVAMAIAMLVRYRRGTQGQLADLRRDYLKYLTQTRRAVLRTARLQRDAQFYLHPSPEQLWALVAEGSRVWERRIGDDDFAQVRVGLGSQQLATPLIAPETAPVDELEPLTAGAMRQFLTAHGTLDGLPMAVSLRAFYHLTVSGDGESARSTARAMVGSLAALHSPEDLVVAVAADAGAAPSWEWAKWLPHVQASGPGDGAGSRRLITTDARELEDMLGARLEGRPRFQGAAHPLLDHPHLVVVLDGQSVPQASALASPEGIQGVTIIEVVQGRNHGPRGDLSVIVEGDSLRLESGHGHVYDGTPDRLGPDAAEALARQLAPLRVASGADDDEPLLANLDFTDLLNLGDAASVDVARTWRPRSRSERLRVPIGVGEDGVPVMLDLKEAAQEGMGPHGLCVGATGSGKSELLRTLVLGLAVTHSSETLNFVLADFKGGATFAGMSQMPHVAAVITNLADDLTLVDRMGDSIRGELNRRQEMLRDAGNYANIHDYEKARAAGAPLQPIPSLVLVIDEFSELLTAMPDFIEMFVQIGRIGRSLGVHLLLASQRLEEGRLRGLETYLSYRIGLRTFSAAESRAAIGVPDAYTLPNVPGSGYLKYGTDEMVRFKAAYVSGVYRTNQHAAVPGGPLPVDRRPALFTAAHVPVHHVEPAARERVPEARRPEDDALADSVLDVIVRRLEGRGVEAHQVWLPPLDNPPPLDAVLPGLAGVEGRGLTQPGYEGAGRLVVPLGVVDKPYEQRRDTLYRDFSGAAGHMQIIGGPQSGKSTLLRTIVSAFALTHTPHEVQFYGLDFGGGGLSSVAGLPHVGGVASRLDPERVRRTVAEVYGVMSRREEYFRSAGIDSISTYRRLRARGDISVKDQPWGDVFLVIDGWGNFRTEYEGLEAAVVDVAARGLGYGIHVILTASRSMEVRANLKDHLMNRLELRLGDTMDSELDRKIAANVPTGVPGRGLTPEKLHFMAAVPRIDGINSDSDLSEATAAMTQEVTRHWTAPGAPEVRLLPRELDVRELPAGDAEPGRGVAFAIDENGLEPVFVDFDRDPFFLVFGESESGKSNLLRLLIKQISERYDGSAAKFFVIDNRRALLDVAPASHLAEYVPMSNNMEHHVDALADLMRRRSPSADVTAQQLRERSWWQGPSLFVVVDDYDLVSTSSGNPLSKLTELLPFARDVGVRFIIARSAAGASRAAYESFMQRMMELGAQGVLLSGDPQEGDVLGGVRMRPMPAGRGVYVSRQRGNPLVQTGRVPEV